MPASFATAPIASMSMTMPPGLAIDSTKIAAGAGPDVVRLSVGLEDVEDIIGDLKQALG